MRELAAPIAATIHERTAALQEQGANAVAQAAAELRAQMGAEAYDRLVADAKASGVEVSPAVQADAYSLRMLASQGAYRQAYERTRPKL
jgi:hypothetical protein